MDYALGTLILFASVAHLIWKASPKAFAAPEPGPRVHLYAEPDRHHLEMSILRVENEHNLAILAADWKDEP